ncbi:MAG: tetratricopeptide repeat protein [Treponemataceae bacterium]
MKKTLFSVLLIFAIVCSIFAQEKLDALVLYRKGRSLESQGDFTGAKEAFQKSVEVCQQELKVKPNNIESYVVLTWSKLRLEGPNGKPDYKGTIVDCQNALKINPKEYRIIETMAEAYFYDDNYKESLKYFEQYVNGVPREERVATAYFFMGEIFRITHRYEHADIAYCTALQKEPTVALWWYRLGRARESNGNKLGAKNAYQNALKYKPNYQDASDALKRVS